MQDVKVTRELIIHLQGKKFTALSNLVKIKFSKDFNEKVGLKSDFSVAKVAESIKPYLGTELSIVTKGNASYLAYKQSTQERITEYIKNHQGCSPGVVVQALKLHLKSDIIKELNSLNTSGLIRIELTPAYSLKLFTTEKKSATGNIPSTQPVDDQIIFKKAFDSLDHGRIFVRIFEVRRNLGWPREKFDIMLNKLRDECVIQLHSGDNSSMKSDETDDSYIDDNGFLHITMTWRKG